MIPIEIIELVLVFNSGFLPVVIKANMVDQFKNEIRNYMEGKLKNGEKAEHDVIVTLEGAWAPFVFRASTLQGFMFRPIDTMQREMIEMQRKIQQNLQEHLESEKEGDEWKHPKKDEDDENNSD